jgi:glycosyltransferase involved in cell wall biosynthesis
MENPGSNRLDRRFVGLFSVYAGDQAPALFESLWTMLRNQTQPLDWTVGVIEGDLTPELEDVIGHFSEVAWTRIPKVKNKLNFGLPLALNHGLSLLAESDVVLKIDTDDLYPNNRVQRTLEAFAGNRELSLFGGQVEEWNKDYSDYVGSRAVPLDHEQISKYGKRRNPFNGPTVAFRADLAKELGGFSQVGANEDYVLWAQMIQSGAVVQNSPEVLAFMRGGPDLVVRRSTARTRRGELEALRAIKKSGYFSTPTYCLHVLAKQLVRRLPIELNLYLYQYLRHRGVRPVPSVVARAAKALSEWQS